MQLSTDLEIAGLLTRISLNSEGLIYSTLLRITSDNLKVSNENFSTIYSNNILISTEILNTVIIFELIKTVVNLNLSNEDLELLLHPFGEKIYTQLHFSPFIDWDFDPNSIWIPLASNSSNQINISHLTSALTNYVTFEDLEELIPSPSANINVINDWGLAVTSEDVLGATLGYYLKEEQIRIEDKIDNLFYFTNNTTTSRYPLNINGDLNVFNNIHATGGVSAGGIGDLFESGGVGFTGVVEEKTGNSNVVTGGHKDDSNIVFEMALEVYSKDDTNDLLDTKVDKVAGYGLSQNNLTDELIQSINNVITDAYTKTYIDNNFVPYVGASKDVNLGDYSLVLFNLNASNNIHAEGGVSAGGIGDLAETTSIIDLYRSWDDLHPTNKALEATLGVELHNSLTGLSSASHTHSNKGVLDDTTAAFLYEEKIKLAGIEANATKYILPYATSAVLGGVTVGSNIDINDGVISVKDASTLNKGVVQLSDSTGSPSSLIAATSKAVKAAWDLADSKWLWNENTIKGVVVNRSLTADKLTAPINLWGQLFDGSSDINGDLHSTGNISADGGVSAGGIGDLSEAITSGYNDILPHPDNTGNAVTSITSNGGSILYYRMLKSFSEVGHKHDTAYSLLGHIHDDRYYTEVEISNILSGLTSATGYNKSNWDTAYDWGNHDSVGYALASTLSTHMDNVSNPHAVTKAQVGLGNVEDTKLSTWAGTADITTLGTISSGTWNATPIEVSKGGTGKTSIAIDRMLYASSANTYSEVITTSFGRGILSAISGTEVAGLRAATATKLASSVYLWGNEFNGTQSLDGHIESIGDIHTTQRIYGDTGVYAGGIGDLAESNSGGYNNVEYDDAQGVIVDYVSNVVSNTSSLKVYRNKLKTNLSQYIDDLGINPIHSHSQYMLGSARGAVNGVAPLDENRKLPAAYLYDYFLGQVLYGGGLGANALATLTSLAKSKLDIADATITLTNDTDNITGYIANEGIYYIVTAAQTFAGISFEVGDWCISNGPAWTKVDNTDAVASVAGLTGAISKASLLSALNVADGAQVNVIENITLNGGTNLPITSKVVNVNACTSITVPTGLSVASLTSGGVITLSYASGYAIPTIQSITDINTNISNHDACIGALAGQVLTLQSKNQFDELYSEYGHIRTLSADLLVGIGSLDAIGDIRTSERIYGAKGVFSGGIGDLAESGSSGYNQILLKGSGNAVTSISDNGGSTLFYNRDKTFSESTHNHNSVYSLLGHNHDDRYYTEAEIGNILDGSTAITGYNRVNWDTAFGWGNHASVGYALTSALTTHANLTTTAHGLGASAFHADNYFALAGHNHSGVYQPLDADLTAIVGLIDTSGFLKKTAANTWSLDTNVYLTGITKAQVEAVLTGAITSHTHSYQAPLTGTGFVKSTAGVISYDTNTYLTTHQTIYGLTIQKNGTTIDVYTPNSSSKTINISDVASASALSSLDAATDACIGALSGQVSALQSKNQFDELYSEYANIRTLSSDLFVGYLKGNADSASKLLNARTLWGRPFDGDANVSGNMTGVGSIESTGNIHTTQRIYGDSGVFAGGIGDLAEFLSSGYNLISTTGSGNAVTSVDDNGSTLNVHKDITFAVASDVTNSLATKVDKVTGYGLSKNDLTDVLLSALNANTAARHSHSNKSLLDSYTQTESDLASAVSLKHTHSNKTVLDATTASFLSADRTKLDGIATGANLYVHPTYTARTSGLYKVTVDSSGHVSAIVAVAKSDITALGIPTQDTVYVHPASGVTAGTYRSVTVDVNGHVTTGTNPTTLAGYGITDAASASALSTLDANIDACIGSLAGQLLTLQSKNQYDELYAEYINVRTISAELLIGELSGNAATATKLSTGRTLKVNLFSTSASTAFNGAADVSDIGVSGILSVANGGTGLNALTSGYALIGNGTGVVNLRAITNSTTLGYIVYNSNLMTTNTLAFWNGAYNSSGTSNIAKLGTITAGVWHGTMLDTKYGGTGNTVFTQGKLIYAESTTKLSSMSSTVGSTSVPIYLNEGAITACISSQLFSGLSWDNGTTSGPALNITVTGQNRTSVIPSASASVSGIVTTGAQTFAGSKTFSSIIIGSINGNADTVDNLHASDFVRVTGSVTQTITGSKIFSASTSFLNSISVANNINAGGIIQGVGGVFAGGIADLQEDSWTTPTLINGTHGTTYGTVRYRKIGNNVQIDGSFTITISNIDGVRIFQLPTGYNPIHKMSMLMYNNSEGIWRCVVSTDGSVYVNYIYRITNGSLITTSTTCIFDKCIFPIN